MDKIPENLRYSKEHEWALMEGDVLTVGITHHAQSQLGDVVYVELPAIGRQIEKDKVFGVVESVKAVSDLFAPVSGEVVAINDTLPNKPEEVNADPYGEAWMIKIKPTRKAELEELMDAAHYARYLKELAK
jgi:glycine cleavage system H protein